MKTRKETQERGFHIVVSGNTAEQPTAAKRHTEQDGRPNMSPTTYHSYTGEARPHQSEHVVAKICPVQKNDESNRHINHDEQQENTATVP